MSVATKNPFALLDEDSSSPPSAPAPTKSAPAAEAPAAAARGGAKTRGPASRGGRYYQRGGKPRDASGDAPAEDSPAEGGRKFDGEGRGRGRGRGRGDRGRGGRGAGRFDRQSRSGQVDSEKKVNQGWGADEGNAELTAEMAGATDAAVETTTGDAWGAPAEAGTDDPWAAPTVPADGIAVAPIEGEKPDEGRKPREREPEEEDNTLTYEQYLAQQKEKLEASAPKLEVRQANEGDDSWKDSVVQKKGEEEQSYFAGKTKNTPKPRAKKEDKVFLEIDARFDRPNRGRGRGGDRGRGTDRGGERGGERGRGRGGRGGRGPRQNGGAQPAINVDDETAFPSLS